MHRLAEKPITLSDGTKLPAGCQIVVQDDKGMDEATFQEPTTFDASRFLHLREKAGEENHHQFVTATPDHMAFGLGQHACPGRFFASNEIKIALCFLLMKYDIRLAPGEARLANQVSGTAVNTHPQTKIQLRRREEEIDMVTP